MTLLHSVLERLQSFNRLAAGINSLVSALEVDDEKDCEQDHSPINTNNNGRPHDVIGGILSPENRPSHEATQSPGADSQCGAECALPLATDVVLLPG